MLLCRARDPGIHSLRPFLFILMSRSRCSGNRLVTPPSLEWARATNEKIKGKGQRGVGDSSFLMKRIFFVLKGANLEPVGIELLLVPDFGLLPSPPTHTLGVSNKLQYLSLQTFGPGCAAARGHGFISEPQRSMEVQLIIWTLTFNPNLFEETFRKFNKNSTLKLEILYAHRHQTDCPWIGSEDYCASNRSTGSYFKMQAFSDMFPH